MKINENNIIIDCSRSALSVLSNALKNISQAVDENECSCLIGITKVNIN